MLSSWLPWDMISNHPTILTADRAGIYGLWAYDPYVERICLNRIPKNFFENEELRPVLGSEITIDWLEDNFQSLGLFGNSESYLVLNAEDISSKVMDFILEGNLSVENRYLIFNFSKSSKFFDKLGKSVEGTYFKVTAPRFWESKKLLDFLCQELKVKVPYQVANFLIESIPFENCGEIVHALNLIQLHFPDQKNIDIEEVRELVSATKFDQFYLASLFGSKKFVLFWGELIKLSPSYEQLRSFVVFIQGHMHKIADPSYIGKKKKPSKYDNEILTHSRLWSSKEVRHVTALFSEMEIMAKSRDPLLLEVMRSSFLKSMPKV